MSDPVRPNKALIPRNPVIWQDDTWRDEEIEEEFKTYAPPGAQFRARVRRLGNVDDLLPVPQVQDKTNESQPSGKISIENEGTGIRIRIQTEILLQDSLSNEGCIIETQTRIRKDQVEKTRKRAK